MEIYMGVLILGVVLLVHGFSAFLFFMGSITDLQPYHLFFFNPDAWTGQEYSKQSLIASGGRKLHRVHKACIYTWLA